MHSLFTVALLALPAWGAAVAGVTKRVTLDIANTKASPDGVERVIVSANGQYPGPLITANKGDKVIVTVNNKLTDATMRRSTAINFDGIFQSAANLYNEGSAFVTTCPISPGGSYTYEVDLAEQAGTYWYHSQLSVQYLDGLRGPFIVYDPKDPLKHLYDVDDASTIVQLGDWWQNPTLGLLSSYEATGIIPVSDSGTFNGRGRFNGGPAVPWSVVNVVSGKRYRLRIINESGRNVFNMSVDSHDLLVIAADGVEVTPHTTQNIQMLAGQRYDAVLTANQAVGNYWINAPYIGGSPARNPHQNATLSRGILRYRGAPAADPTTPMTLGPDTVLDESELRPLVDEVPPQPDVEITLNLEVVAGQAIWNVNDVSYLPSKVPTLEQILEGATEPADFNVTENAFVLPRNATVQITFPATDDDDAHPLHMHGMNVWVVKSMNGAEPNEVNPIKRDVVGVGATGTTIRFRTDKPGPWFFHCHIFWHMQAGLATIMVADPAGAREEIKPSAAWEALCPAYNALPADQQ